MNIFVKCKNDNVNEVQELLDLVAYGVVSILVIISIGEPPLFNI
jgi:hypothetical protein